MRCSCGNFLGFAFKEDAEKELKCGQDYLYVPCLLGLSEKMIVQFQNKPDQVRGCGKVTIVTYTDIRSDRLELQNRARQYVEALHNLPGTPLPQPQTTLPYSP